ncbi:transcription regulator [Agrilactobacillus composti DSM 18527 = JCM 14202]|uniref:Transcription regulator n=1 Tax=Agrilactobacillus composti DSM 18527 = JCM 14202 TaxID=1423734 RepID=X0PEQ6_9LACO|nr:MurR/RpiR family transcriptional regulator [Agrilactobacillus composti]KRM36265.1 transcription regulator [Agrilactobacillus composti DSM 18527 = JCM 14202]GAF40008.1 sialic acid utilization regulator, RpiR family [Agrilactobacillus composti DSM 18527 = JCM 14202]
MNIVRNVENQYANLSRQERKVALKVMQTPSVVQQMTISKLANAVGVSNATITRFVKKMGCRDFYTFKLQLAGNHPSAQPTPAQAEISDQVYNFYQTILTGTLERLNLQDIKQAVADITQAKRVYLFGLGSSGYTVNEMTQRLLRMGIAAFAMTDSHIMYINSSIVSADDVVLVISLTGNTNDVNRAVKLAKAKGAKILAVTAFEDSPLASLSDLTILVKNSNFVANTRFVNSQFAIIYALDIITTLLLENDAYRAKMNQTVALITDDKFRSNPKI